MKSWLKVLCVLLLLYTAIIGFIVPLIPGGLDVDVETIRPGETQFTFTGYNTHFLDEKDKLQVFVAVDTSYFCAEIVRVEDNSHAAAKVILPDTLSSTSFAFYANTPTDGTVYVRKSLRAEGFTEQAGGAEGACRVSVETNEHADFGYPFQIIIFETIRNLMWHVPMWFTMFVLMLISFSWSIGVLRASGNTGYNRMMELDLRASSAASTGMVFCILGLITGSIWARFTWGAWWTNDPQLNGAMVVFLVYAAYFVLRRSVEDEEKRARLSAIFNLFAAVLMIILLMVMPRFAEGLHPGKSGNPAFSSYDLDSSLRAVFYPAVLGWILLGYWLYTLQLRIRKLEWNHEKNPSITH